MNVRTKIYIGIGFVTFVLVILIFLSGQNEFVPAKTPTVSEDGEEIIPNFGSGGDIDIRLFDTSTVGDDRIERAEDLIGIEGIDSFYETTKIFPVINTPVAGYKIEKGVDGNFSIDIVETGVGHIFKVNASPYSVERISNLLVPKTQRAHFLQNNGVVIEYQPRNDSSLKNAVYIDYGINIPTGDYLPSVLSVATSPDTDEYFYTKRKDGGVGVEGIFADAITGEKTLVWDSEFESWLPVWSEGGLRLLPKPSENLFGALYSLSKSGIFNRISPSERGLAILENSSRNLDAVFNYKQIRRSASGIKIVDKNTKSKINTKIKTLFEKCVWKEQYLYCAVPKNINAITTEPFLLPDSWYQGDAVYEDTFLRFNTDLGIVENLLDPIEFELAIDATNIQVSPNQAFVFFINSRTNLLWGIRL